MRSLATFTLVLALCAPAVAKPAKAKKPAAKPAAKAQTDADLEADKEARAKAAFDAAGTHGADDASADGSPAPDASPAAAGAAPAAPADAPPGAAAGAAPAPGEDPNADAAAVAKMLELSSGQAPAPTGPPAALARKLVPVLVALNQYLRVQPPLKMQELQYFGAADVDGNGVSELILSWARGQNMGGVALATKTEAGHKVIAVADVKEPVLRVQAIPLAGDKSRHLLVRSGTAIAEGGTTRRMAVWGAVHGKLSKIWEQRDVDRIENNGDISSDREAQLSDVTFKDGAAGKTGSLTVAVTEYRAPKGKGPEATETRASRTLHYVFDRSKGILVLKSKKEATPEQLKKDELGAAGPGAAGVVPDEAPQGEERVARRSSDDTPVNQRDPSTDEVVNATGLRAREAQSRIDIPASPARRMVNMEMARRKRAEDNKRRQQKMEEAARKAEEEANPTSEESPEPTGEESGPRPKGVEAVDGAK